MWVVRLCVNVCLDLDHGRDLCLSAQRLVDHPHVGDHLHVGGLLPLGLCVIDLNTLLLGLMA